MEQEAAGATSRHLHAVPLPRDDAAPAPASLSREDAAPAVQDLLAQLDDLRTLLSTDLGLAASAVDADEIAVARDVIAGAQDDLAVFGVRAGHGLREPVAPAPLQAVPAPRRRRHRLSLLAPGLTAAAALVGVLLGVVPSTTPPAAPDSSIATDAASSWDELRRLHEQGAPTERLARAARRLHAEVSRLVGAGASPAAVTEALRLLELQRRVLTDPQHADELGAELAESQRLVAALRATAPGSPAGTLLADAPLPAAGRLPTALPAAPTTDAPSTVPAPAPAGRPRPAAVPVPAPQQSADAAPTEQQSAPAPSPSASPSPGTSAGEAGTAPEAAAPASAPPAPLLPPRTGTLLPE